MLGGFIVITPEMIARINELSQKQRSIGLTEAEKVEQAALRRQYIDNIKAQVRSQIETATTAGQHDESCSCGCRSRHPH